LVVPPGGEGRPSARGGKQRKAEMVGRIGEKAGDAPTKKSLPKDQNTKKRESKQKDNFHL